MDEKPRFYYQDIDNYHEEHLKRIIWWQKSEIDNLKELVKQYQDCTK